MSKILNEGDNAAEKRLSARFPVYENLSPEDTKKVYDQLKENYDAHQTSRITDKGRWDYSFRIKNIKGMIRFIKENESAILEAARKDIGRTSGEWTLERAAILGDLNHIRKWLRWWMAPEKRSTPLWMQPGSSFIVRESYGVCLVMSAFNYNITLSMLPAAGALAAGNACIMKPSELAPNQALLMAQVLPRYVDPACFRVVLGEAEHARTLVDTIPWDFVFFTGSTRVGAIVGESCAKRNIPCSLELGGKSPTIVDKSCDLPVACRRIVQSKFVNCGATCVAPDYLIIIGDENRKREVFKAIDAEIIKQLGNDASQCSQYARIVNESHFKRLEGLMKGGQVARGGKTDASKLFIEPTLLDHVDLDAPLMVEEIFGPLLPAVLCEDVDSAVQFIRERPKPLALYIFSSNSTNVRTVLARTSAGSCCVNEAVFQYLNYNLPFGGVGPAGHGAYHGKASFLEFSHEKSCMWRWTAFDIKYRYLPYIGNSKIQKLFGCLMAI